MLDQAKLKEALQRSGIPPQELERAGAHADERKIPFVRALVDLNIAQYQQIGKCLSAIHLLPYHSLLSTPPSPPARGLLSQRCACRWKVFPYAYHQQMNLLTMAVHDPGQMDRVQAIHKFFMQPFRLAFTIASEPEIDKAFEVHLGMAPSTPVQGAAKEDTPAAVPAKRSLSQSAGTTKPAPAPAAAGDAPPGKKVSSLAEALKRKKSETAGQDGGDRRAPMDSVRMRRKPAQPENPAEEKEPAQEKEQPEESKESSELSHSLISAATLLVGAHLGDDSKELADTRARVRYCQLLATKLGMSTVRIDKVVLAAWMSGLKNRRQVIKQFVTPYDLDEIVFADESDDSKLSSEAQVLKLVTCYQEMKERDPNTCKDVNLTRRSLRLLWSSSPDSQDMLEAFLQLLMDEEFLSTLDRATGSILIVDPVEVSTSSLAPPLANDGYDVNVVPGTAAAEGAISESQPNLIIVAFDLPQTSGLKFCQKLKRNSATGGIPILMIMTPESEQHVAECLRAGVDDYVVRPVNLELLFLKTQKLMTVSPAESSRAGVSGSLEDMSFTDMIQILCAGSKSMAIDLRCDNAEGQVFVRNGEIIHACVGDCRGESAFYKLMQWSHGEFTTRQCSEFPKPTIDSSTMSLLMEGARLADEGAES